MEQYYIIQKKEKKGPFNLESLVEMDIDENTLVWRRGLHDWIPLKELSEYKQSTPPPLPDGLQTVFSEDIQPVGDKPQREIEIEKDSSIKSNTLVTPFVKWVFFIILYFVYRGLYYSFNVSFVGENAGVLSGLIPAAVTTAFIIAVVKSIRNEYKFSFNQKTTPKKLLYFSIPLVIVAILLIIFSKKYGNYYAILIYIPVVAIFRSTLIAGFDWLENFPIINRRNIQLFLGIASMIAIPVILFFMYPYFIIPGKITGQQFESVPSVNKSIKDTATLNVATKIGESGLILLLPKDVSVIKDSSWSESGANSATIEGSSFDLTGNGIISGSINANISSIRMKYRPKTMNALRLQVEGFKSSPNVKEIKDSTFKIISGEGYEGVYFIGKIILGENNASNKFYVMLTYITDNKTKIWNINLITNGDGKSDYNELIKILHSIKIKK